MDTQRKPEQLIVINDHILLHRSRQIELDATESNWRCANCDRRYTEKEVYRAYLFGGCPDCGDNGSWERMN